MTRPRILLPIALAALGCNNTAAVTLDAGAVDVPVADLAPTLDAPEVAPADDAGPCTWDAAVEDVPKELLKQLTIGGKMIIPVYNTLAYFERRGEDDFYHEQFSGFVFVPLVEKSI